MKLLCLRNGYLLPMVIILVFISLMLGFSILYLGGTGQIAANRRLSREKAFYIAEAGAQRAFALFRNNSSWIPEANAQTLADGTFSVTQTKQGTQAEWEMTLRTLFTSMGTVRGVRETVSVLVGRKGSFAYGSFGSVSATLNNVAGVDSYDSRLGPYGGSNVGQDGDIGSLISVRMDNNSWVYGDVAVAGGEGNITMGNGAVLTGDTIYNADFPAPLNDLSQYPVIIPADLSGLAYPSQGDSRIIVNSGSYTLSNGNLNLANNALVTITGGDFRFRSVTLSNNSTLTMTGNTRFYIEQSFVLSNNTRMTWTASAAGVIYLGSSCTTNFDNNSVITNTSGVAGGLRIYSASSNPLSLYNNAQALAALIYAPNATVTLVNNAQFYGSIISGVQLLIQPNAALHYDVALRDIIFSDDPGATAPPVIMRWTKPGWTNRLQ